MGRLITSRKRSVDGSKMYKSLSNRCIPEHVVHEFISRTDVCQKSQGGSFYDRSPLSPNQDGKLRLSDHWNFKIGDMLRFVTDVPIEPCPVPGKKTWACATFDNHNKIWRVLAQGYDPEGGYVSYTPPLVSKDEFIEAQAAKHTLIKDPIERAQADGKDVRVTITTGDGSTVVDNMPVTSIKAFSIGWLDEHGNTRRCKAHKFKSRSITVSVDGVVVLSKGHGTSDFLETPEDTDERYNRIMQKLTSK